MQEIIYEDFRDWNCILRIILYQKNQYFPSTCLNKLNKYILSFINLTFANDESQRWFTNSNIVHPITLFPLKEVGVSLLIAILVRQEVLQSPETHPTDEERIFPCRYSFRHEALTNSNRLLSQPSWCFVSPFVTGLEELLNICCAPYEENARISLHPLLCLERLQRRRFISSCL